MHTVLLVKTGLGNTETLVERVKESGFEVRQCSTISGAIQIIRDGPTPSAMIVSESADRTDTIGVLDRLDREYPEIRTVALLDSLETVDQTRIQSVDCLLSSTASPETIVQTLSQMVADAEVDEALECSQSFITAVADSIETDADVGEFQVEQMWEAFLEIEDCLAVWVSQYHESSGQLVPETVFGLGADIKPEPVDIESPTGIGISSQQVGTTAAPRYQTRMRVS